MKRHIYFSTSCWHEEHDYCNSATRDEGVPKVPARCKFCEAKCVCWCHNRGPGIERVAT